jgi:hypothetical protein
MKLEGGSIEDVSSQEQRHYIERSVVVSTLRTYGQDHPESIAIWKKWIIQEQTRLQQEPLRDILFNIQIAETYRDAGFISDALQSFYHVAYIADPGYEQDDAREMLYRKILAQIEELENL